MIDLLFEGFETALLPCSLILLIPGAATLIAARQESTPAFLGFAGAVIAVSWLRFAGRVDDPAPGLIAVALASAVVLLLAPIVRRLDIVSAGGGALAGGAAAFLWVPCVGEQFGTLLGELPDRGPSGAGLLAGYLLGVLAPLAFLAAAMHLIPGPFMLPARPVMMLVGGTVLGLLAATVAAGFEDRLISRLVESSL